MKATQTLIASLILIISLLSLPLVAETEAQSSDYKWFQINLMRSQDAKIPFEAQDVTYLELEFGGRSQALDLYGYLDVFDIGHQSSDDRHEKDNMFLKLSPRFSLNEIFDWKLSSNSLLELYFATLMNVGENGLFETYFGIGSDWKIPWLGKTALNLYARHVRENYGAENENTWDGYLISSNWFKPIYNFSDNSFLSYQGYLDFKFEARKIYDDGLHSKESTEWFHGFYWHTPKTALGYGLKYFNNMALIKHDSIAGETSGLGHYLSLTYKM